MSPGCATLNNTYNLKFVFLQLLSNLNIPEGMEHMFEIWKEGFGLLEKNDSKYKNVMLSVIKAYSQPRVSSWFGNVIHVLLVLEHQI